MVSCFPCRIRLVEEKDFVALEEIFRSHEGAKIPEGYFEDFCASIRSSESLYFVAEIDGEVVGGGGINDNLPEPSVFFYGIVAAEHCGKGIGTSLLVARLYFLANSGFAREIILQATEVSQPFFERLGFNWYAEEVDENENIFYWGISHVREADQDRFWNALVSGGVELSDELKERPKFIGFG